MYHVPGSLKINVYTERPNKGIKQILVLSKKLFLHKQFHLLFWQLESFFHSTGLEQIVVFTDQHVSVCITRDIHQDLEISVF